MSSRMLKSTDREITMFLTKLLICIFLSLFISENNLNYADDIAEVPKGRTTIQQHETFFDPKTFGEGEGGEERNQLKKEH